MSRHGMHIDLGRLELTEKKYRDLLDEAVGIFERDYPGIFKFDRRGNPVVSKKTGTPSKSDKKLEEYLLRIIEEIQAREGRDVAVPRTPKGKVSLQPKIWKSLAPSSPLVKL